MLFSKKSKNLNYKKNCVQIISIGDKNYEVILNISLLTFIESSLNEFYEFVELKDKKPIYYFLKEFEKTDFMLTNKFIIFFIKGIVNDFLGYNISDKVLEDEINNRGISYFSNIISFLLLKIQTGGEAGELLARIMARRILKKGMLKKALP